MDSKAKRQIMIKRLLRIGVLVLVLWLVFARSGYQRLLPAGMSLYDVIEGMLGGAILSGALAAAVYRAWQDYKKRKSSKK